MNPDKVRLRNLDIEHRLMQKGKAMRTTTRNMGVSEQVLFESGRDGYHTYRIPALLVTRAGTLLAFCEGRVHDRGDHGEIHLLLKRSEDGGRSWSWQQVVWQDGPNTCGNPCPVQDSATGTIWLAANGNPPGRVSDDYFRAFNGRSVQMLASHDDGRTWSPPRDITPQVKRPDWGWYAAGPCTGIELQRGVGKGRLLLPCNHSQFEPDGSFRLYAHVIYSDDHGRTWQPGGRITTDGFDECQAVELNDGRVMLNMRHYGAGPGPRGVAVSADGGLHWDTVRHDPALVECGWGCQASLIRGPDGRLYFSNPASAARERMAVRGSADDGATWTVLKELHAGPAAYSCLAVLPDGRVACLYERGAGHPYETIALAAWPIVPVGAAASISTAPANSDPPCVGDGPEPRDESVQ